MENCIFLQAHLAIVAAEQAKIPEENFETLV